MEDGGLKTLTSLGGVRESGIARQEQVPFPGLTNSTEVLRV